MESNDQNTAHKCTDCLSYHVCSKEIKDTNSICSDMKLAKYYRDFKCEIGDTLYYVSEINGEITPITVRDFDVDKYRIAIVTYDLGYRKLIDVEYIGEKLFKNKLHPTKKIGNPRNAIVRNNHVYFHCRSNC